MRIIAGERRGRRLACPRGARTRPTADRVREAVFSILGERVIDAVVLDLYAGTGALGLEALSRGAARALFVERSDQAVRALHRNIAACGYEARATAVRASVIPFLKGARFPSGVDLVFVDPPYGVEEGALALRALARHVKALAGATVVLEHSALAVPDDLPEGFNVVDTRRWGDTGVTFLGVSERE